MIETPQNSTNQTSPDGEVLEYITSDTVKLNLHFILTSDKKLTLGMPYMMLEGTHSNAVKLLHVWDDEGIVYLKVQDLATTMTYTISWNLMYTGEFWLWSLADFDYLMNLSNKRGGTIL